LEENWVAASTPTPTDAPPSAVALIEEPVATPQPVSEPEVRVAEPVATPVPNEPEPTPVQIAKAIPVAPQPEPAEELIPQPAPAPAPPVPSNNRFQVAVLVPTTAQAVGYLKTISASDAALADNMAETKRAEAYIEWLGAAVKPFENELRKNPDSKESQALEKPIRQALGEVAVLKMRLDDLKTQRLRELEARAQARQSLEKEIQTTRRDQLTRLAGTGA
jgi:FtsZ-binding cell division protein ZapB